MNLVLKFISFFLQQNYLSTYIYYLVGSKQAILSELKLIGVSKSQYLSFKSISSLSMLHNEFSDSAPIRSPSLSEGVVTELRTLGLHLLPRQAVHLELLALFRTLSTVLSK